MTTPGFKRPWSTFALAALWFYAILWPLMGIKPEGLEFYSSFLVWIKVVAAAAIILIIYQLHHAGAFGFLERPAVGMARGFKKGLDLAPNWTWIAAFTIGALIFPHFADRYAADVAVNVLIYICLGLGLNIVIGLAGLLDLGYIAFYGVGAYTYALLSVNFGISFWFCLPVAALAAAAAGCIIGYPTLRMRGDYLAIVTLGFGEIVRILLNNWMSLTNGPNGVLGVKPPDFLWPVFTQGFSLEHIWLKRLPQLYYVVLGLAAITIIAVYRLNYSRIGRAWEAIREDETAAEIMGVNTFSLKLLAYAMGAVFGGLGGAFFAARMKFVSPESFTFIESAMVLSMVILGGMGSIPGVILGALALIVLPELFREFELYRMLAFGGAMALMMIFRPQGLWPNKRVSGRSEEKD
ncbi:MAG: high-affinity branched-chain amino acid ABC transporter permease LivM [Pseudomonadota bacterium]